MNKVVNKKALGKKIILSALKIEESLADIMRLEAKILRKKCVNGAENEDIKRINNMIKNVLFTLTIIDDRIEKGFDLMNDNISEENEDSR